MIHAAALRYRSLLMLRRMSGALMALLLLTAQQVMAGNFAVSPLRVDFDSKANSGALTVTNDAASELRVQIRLYEWQQDENGKDRYQPSDDLLYFPRLATIAPGAKQVIRVGLRGQQTATQEKSYRLFVEELPEHRALTGTQLAVAVRFGVPLFVKPASETVSLAIDELKLVDGKLGVRVTNQGNVHMRITSITASSGEQLVAESSGWYLLPGVSRNHQLTIPSKFCQKQQQLDIKVVTNRAEVSRALDITPAMCSGK